MRSIKIRHKVKVHKPRRELPSPRKKPQKWRWKEYQELLHRISGSSWNLMMESRNTKGTSFIMEENMSLRSTPIQGHSWNGAKSVPIKDGIRQKESVP